MPTSWHFNIYEQDKFCAQLSWAWKKFYNLEARLQSLTLCLLIFLFYIFFCCLLIFSKSTFSKNSFRNTIWVSNRFDQDQARHFFWPYLGPNCLQSYQQMTLEGKELTVCIFIDFSVENSDFGKTCTFCTCNGIGIFFYFQIYMKYIRYSKWHPPLAFQNSDFRFLNAIKNYFLILHPNSIKFPWKYQIWLMPLFCANCICILHSTLTL